jgi:hypothetical protein
VVICKYTIIFLWEGMNEAQNSAAGEGSPDFLKVAPGYS